MRETLPPQPFALLVTRNFPPLLGGMEKVNQHLLAALEPEWRLGLCGPEGCAAHAPPTTQVSESRLKPLARFLLATAWHAMTLALRNKPQWVVAGSGLTAPIAWLVARVTGGRAAVYLHGLDIVAPSRLYRWCWLPFIRHCDLLLANSAHTIALALQNGVPADKLKVLHPGTHMPVLQPAAATDFRDRFGLGKRPLLLSVGRLTQRKGLAEFVEKAMPNIVKRYADVMFVIIGDEASDALHRRLGSERDRIVAAARNAGVGESLCFLGRCDEATLGAACQASNLHIFPVVEIPGDVEGFGMVALEAAAHGLPTVGFSVGGVGDAVQPGRTGTLVAAGDYVGLADAVIQRLAQTRDAATVAVCREYAAGKAWSVFGERLRGLLQAGHE